MDSVTQILLGAAVGEAALGHRVGRKAALWGAVCGTLPDLDILVPFADPVATFTYHRSFSHSLLMLALLTPAMVWLIRKIHPADAHHKFGWYALVYLAFSTHVLLDSATIYGTQIFWPVVTTPMTWGSLFIIDPAFTVPLAIGLAAVVIARHRPRLGYRINAAMLMISTLYFAWSFAAKFHAQGVAREALAMQDIEYRQIVTLAAPFNTILWRFVVMDDGGYLTGWYSLLDEDKEIRFTRQRSEPDLLEGLENHWPVQRLQWFTKGFYGVNREGSQVVVSDLRMGIEGAYVFRFRVGEVALNRTVPMPALSIGQRPDFSLLPDLWQRVLGRKDAFDR